MLAVPAAVVLAPAGLAALVAAGGAAWPVVLLLGLFGAVLALDDTALGQTWFSQPLPAGVLTGAICGDPLSGLAVGLPVQLILSANLPVGQSFTGDATSAVVAAVGAALLSGRDLVPALGTDVRGQVALIGWLVLAVGLLSGLGHVLIQTERRTHSLWMREGYRTLRDGSLQRVERIHLRCLATTFLRGFFVTMVLVLVLRRFWLPVFADLPGFLRDSLVMVPLLLPGLGIGNLVERYGLRDSWIWLIGGAVLSFGAARYLL